MTSIVCVMEGVSKPLFQRCIKQGLLPNISAMINSGYYYDLDTGPVPYEPGNLTSAFSGLGPGHHGIFSYWSIYDTVDNKPRVLDSSDVKVQRLWQWEQLSDLRKGVVNVQLTHKPTEINGFMISYLMNHSLRCSYPGDLLHNLQKDGIRYAHDVSVLYKGEPAEKYSEQIFQVAEYQLDATVNLAPTCDLLIVNLTIADRLSHFLWREIEEKDIPLEETEIVKGYQFLDTAIEKLSRFVTEKDFFCCFTEMGFGPIDKFIPINDELESAGYLKKDVSGNVIKSESVAYEAVQGSHGICISPEYLKHKKIDSGSDGYKEILDNLSRNLLAMRGDDEAPLIKNVAPRDEVYSGPFSHLAPDLIITPFNRRRPPMGDPIWANHVNRHLQTGWHRDEAFLIYQGNQAPLTPASSKLSLEQIAPSIARAANRDYPDYIQHKPIF